MSNQPVKSRRAAREAAFQAAYQCFVGDVPIEEAIEDALARTQYTSDAAEMVREIAEGIVNQGREDEQHFVKHLKEGWSPERLAISDRIALRLAVYELLHMPDVPPKVTISEAVHLAKKFGTENSGAFVNGVLAKVLLDTPKKDWDAAAVIDKAEPTASTDS